ncbi:Uncharacterised protein [Mycobacteroides abscessus subsp. abscessus]|nr:Uncharacterised protein [Mycobacteroides abscessus subsp. abscessus]
MLESEVAAEFMQLVAERMSDNPLNLDGWLTSRRDATGPELPREQWVIYPTRRMVALLLVRNTIRLIRESPDHPGNGDLFQQVAFLFTYGGKEQIA